MGERRAGCAVRLCVKPAAHSNTENLRRSEKPCTSLGASFAPVLDHIYVRKPWGSRACTGGRLQALSGLVHIKGRQAGPAGIAVVKSVPVSE